MSTESKPLPLAQPPKGAKVHSANLFDATRVGVKTGRLLTTQPPTAVYSSGQELMRCAEMVWDAPFLVVTVVQGDDKPIARAAIPVMNIRSMEWE